MEELKRAVEAVNTQRTVQGLGAIEVECLLIFNDENRDAIELLKTHVAPVQADIAQTCPKLHVRSEYLNELFEDAYPKIKGLLDQRSEEHTSELQSLMRISYAVFCLKKKKKNR